MFEHAFNSPISPLTLSSPTFPLSPRSNNVQFKQITPSFICNQKSAYGYAMPDTPPQTPARNNGALQMTDSSPVPSSYSRTSEPPQEWSTADINPSFEVSSPLRASQSSPILSVKRSNTKISGSRGNAAFPLLPLSRIEKETLFKVEDPDDRLSFAERHRLEMMRAQELSRERRGDMRLDHQQRPPRRDLFNPLLRTSAQRSESRRQDFLQRGAQKRDQSRMIARLDEEKRRTFYKEEQARRDRLEAFAPDAEDLIDEELVVQEPFASHTSSMENQERLHYLESYENGDLDEAELLDFLATEQAALDSQLALQSPEPNLSSKTEHYDSEDEDFDEQLIQFMEMEMTKMHVS